MYYITYIIILGYYIIPGIYIKYIFYLSSHSHTQVTNSIKSDL